MFDVKFEYVPGNTQHVTITDLADLFNSIV